MTREELIERFSQAAHDAWLEEKRTRGVSSWPNERGEEQMVPWAELHDDVREFDRVVVGAIWNVMQELKFVRVVDVVDWLCSDEWLGVANKVKKRFG